MSSKAAEPTRRAGFTLVETLVALVVAGLVLSAFARALSEAWTTTRAPMDVVSAIVLARAATLDAPADAFRDAVSQGFSIQRSTRATSVVVGLSGLAPAPAAEADLPPEPHSTPSAIQLAEPTALIAASLKPQLVLRTVSIVVRTPLGRHVRFDSIRADRADP